MLDGDGRRPMAMGAAGRWWGGLDAVVSASITWRRQALSAMAGPADATGSRDRTGRVRAGLPIGWGGGAHARRRRRRGRGGGGVCGRIASHSYCTPRAFPWWVVGFEARLRFLSLPTMHSILFNGYYLRSFFR